MNRIFFVSFLTVCLTMQISSQPVPKIKPPTGLYFGGVSYSDEMMGIGYYYFKKDSSFIFISTTSNPKVPSQGNIKNTFTDTLGGYGKGKWFIKDSFFVIKFDSVKNYSVQNDDVVYHSFLKYPYDSISIKINLVDKMYGRPVMAAITIKELNRFIVTDTLGYGALKLPFKYGEYRININHPDYHEKTIVLVSSNNIHELKIALQEKVLPYINVVKAFTFPLKLRVNEKGEIQMFNLKKENASIETLIQIINNGCKKMPEQKIFLEKIMDEVKLLK